MRAPDDHGDPPDPDDETAVLDEPTAVQPLGAPTERLAVPDDPVARVRDITFPVALRGYDRGAVDDYVDEVINLVAELEAHRSPDRVVQRALSRVGEETAGILEAAHRSAEEIATRSRLQAEERVADADRESERIRDAAERRVRELDAEVAALRRERDEAVRDLHALAGDVARIADAALERFAIEPAELGAHDEGDEGDEGDDPPPGPAGAA